MTLSRFCPLPHQAEDDILIDNAFGKLMASYLASNHRRKVDIIRKAFSFARNVHRDTRRLNGDPFILHPIAVAQIAVAELGLGSTSICAALLHEVLEQSDYTSDDLRPLFGNKIAAMVEALTKISGGIFGDKASVEAENFRKLLLSMSADVRVILVKMADRLHNLRTLDVLLPLKQQRIARETLYVYAPLAHRLGLNLIKSELEDLAFSYEHPQEHAEISRMLAISRPERQKIVDEFIAPVRVKLDEAGFKYEIKARVKTPYSIYKKMTKKNISFEEVYDIFAIRVIFENEDDSLEKIRCWEIYTAFTENHQVHPERLRDWTSTPKANGYRALHITVMGPSGRWIEVQIRSRKMDDIAELGLAAHWKYKTGEQGTPKELDNWMNTIKELLAHPGPDALDFLETIRLSLYSKEIYIFSPKGDLITLPAGSSVLDLAFALDDYSGLHCLAGKINHRLYPLSHTLQSGDQVEIITSKSVTPSREWIPFCHTAKAKTALLAHLSPP